MPNLIRPLSVLLLLLSSPLLAQVDAFSAGGSLSSSQLLRVEQAFRPQALSSEDGMEMVWAIEPGYYLYRKQFRVFADGEEIGQLTLPEGQTAYDPFFDEELEIYRDETEMEFPLGDVEEIRVRFQGCADAGYCYPPSWVAFTPSAESDAVAYLGLVEGPATPVAEPDTVSTRLMVAMGTGLFLVLGILLFWVWKFRNPS